MAVRLSALRAGLPLPPGQYSAVFLVVTSHDSENARRFGGTYGFHIQCRTVTQAVCRLLQQFSRFIYFSGLKIEAICSSETSGFFLATRRYNSEERTFRSQRYENLKFETQICNFIYSILDTNPVSELNLMFLNLSLSAPTKIQCSWPALFT
jgi:hypothetical protein